MTLNTGNGHTVLPQQDLCQQFPPTFYDFPYISVTDVKFRHIYRFSRFSRQVVNLITKDKLAEQNKTVAPYYYCCWFLYYQLIFSELKHVMLLLQSSDSVVQSSAQFYHSTGVMATFHSLLVSLNSFHYLLCHLAVAFSVLLSDFCLRKWPSRTI